LVEKYQQGFFIEKMIDFLAEIFMPESARHEIA